MVKIKEWENHFEGKTKKELKEISHALITLLNDNMINKEYKESGLDILKAIIDAILKYKGDK